MAQKSQGTGTSNRGFASMDAAKQREIASKGGQSVPAAKRSFSQDRRLAAEAGRKGGQSSHGGGRSKQPGTSEQVASASHSGAGSSGSTEHHEGHEPARSEPEKVDH
jgi:general stress protein YciG